ncbi:retrovirus-related pol polyprotein from transposon TNT 1-94 [Tanacetum coccineum]
MTDTPYSINLNTPYKSVECQYAVLISQNMPYCLEEQIRHLDYRIQYVVLGRRFDMSYPTSGYGVSVYLLVKPMLYTLSNDMEVFSLRDWHSYSDVEEDQRTSNEFMTDLNVEYHERALLANQKRFYKRSERVGSTRKLIDKSKETCFTCERPGYFQKDCPSNKTSTPSYPSSNNSFNKPKPYTRSFNQTSSQNTGNHQKDYKGKYKGLKDEMVVLTKRIDDLTKRKSEKGKNEKGKSEKGFIAESFDWDEESIPSEDEGTTKIRAFMAIAEDEPSVGKLMCYRIGSII